MSEKDYDFNKMFGADKPPVETMPGTQAGSTFLVIAKNMGLKLGIRPIPALIPDEEDTSKGWHCAAFRLRCVTTESDASLGLITQAFGIDGLKEKGNYASAVFGVKLMTFPAHPTELNKLVHSAKVSEIIINQLCATLTKAEADIIGQPEQMVEFLNNVYDTVFPEIHNKTATSFNFKLLD